MTWISTEFTKSLVSIIIPVYNRENLIIETLKSIAEQTYWNIECILVDDGSTDNTGDTIRSFIEEYIGSVKYIYIYQKNQGAQVARNRGTKESSGEFIQYLDSDDLLNPDKLKQQVDFLHTNDGFHAVFGDWNVGSPLNKTPYYPQFRKTTGDVNDYIINGPLVNFSVLMHRREMIQIGPWDELLTINEEVDYHIRFLLHGFKFGYQEQICGLWRFHEGDRLSNCNNFKNLFYYYCKITTELKAKNKWTKNVGEFMANNIMWSVLDKDFTSEKTKIDLIILAHSLNDKILPFKSKKVRLLSKIIGKRLSIGLWLKFFKKNQKK